MTALTDFPPATVGERRAALCEIADLYSVEQKSNDRPLTDVLPALLDGLRGNAVPIDAAVDLFDRFARLRAVLGSALVSYDVIAVAELNAERLLDQLVGETDPA